VTAAVYQAASLDESLRRIVELAPPALGVDICTVDLIVGAGGAHMIVAAATPPFDKTIGQRFATAGSNAERVVRERRMVVVADATNDPSLHPEFRASLKAGSVIYVPLFQGNGRPLGMLVLVRHQVGPFSDEQLRLAQVFSTRAAAAIENAQLYQQSRRDAEAKAMLLRELNHRVKNNLAGIVGLLNSTQPVDLSPAGRQWLDRVTERINVMGRAHELFVGGPQRVELGALVDQVLPSLSVVKPPGVHVRKDLDGVRVALPTERAVALAMVLHELCYNAIAHGLAGRADGLVTIRARGAAEPGRVLVEVSDDGVGFGNGNPAPSAARTDSASPGWGLTLVRGLVARELRGKFSLSPGPERGTIAAIEFPVTADDA
jgi:two-component sensor histidine kinase